uniref:Uncharacterized protein n=1 Tax=Setaria italica TaxID=4555 RepID=K3Y444_SETIT
MILVLVLVLSFDCKIYNTPHLLFSCSCVEHSGNFD